ncbi:hypothetical protein M1N92_03425 [Dehalococcoidia bacterium]|nr:hypothetical protein [Dehalococcoidia bacterium]
MARLGNISHQSRTLMKSHLPYLSPVHKNNTCFGLQNSVDALDKGGFSRPVGEAYHLSSRYPFAFSLEPSARAHCRAFGAGVML